MASQATENHISAQHFALIYIDQNGEIHREVSTSISHYRDTILSPQVTAEFLKAVIEGGLQNPSLEFLSPQLHPGYVMNHRPYGPRFQKNVKLQGHIVPAAEGYHEQHTLWPGHGKASPAALRDELLHRERSCMQTQSLESQEAVLSIKDTKFLRRYYEKVFQNVQQTNCRVLAKAFVKLVEPKKQVKYPYNGRKVVAGEIRQLNPEESKPPWWPPKVRHREPDHLLKAGNMTFCCVWYR
jgi:hypothetical protein